MPYESHSIRNRITKVLDFARSLAATASAVIKMRQSPPLQNVVFPMRFDMYDLCTSELQQKLKPMREKFMAEEERKNEEKAAMKMKDAPPAASQTKPTDDVECEPFEFPDGRFFAFDSFVGLWLFCASP